MQYFVDDDAFNDNRGLLLLFADNRHSTEKSIPKIDDNNNFGNSAVDKSDDNDGNKEWYLPKNKIMQPILQEFGAAFADNLSNIVSILNALGESFSCDVHGSDSEALNGGTNLSAVGSESDKCATCKLGEVPFCGEEGKQWWMMQSLYNDMESWGENLQE